jgi:dTDP-4-amino-4,6-dideoxygalactose transaminase
MLRGVNVRSPASGLPIADQIMEFGFVLPSNHGMTDDDVTFVTGHVEDFLSGGRTS